MGKRSKKQKGGGAPRNRGGGDTAPSMSRRAMWSAMMGRKPRLWDVLLYEAGGMCSEVCRLARPRVKRDCFSFRESESTGVGWMLGRGLGQVIEQWIGRSIKAGITEPLASLAAGERSTIDAIVSDARKTFGEMLRRYVICEKDEKVPDGDPDVEYLSGVLAAGLHRFLSTECVAGAKLHRCVTEPLAEPSIVLPNNRWPMRPAQGTGSPSMDVYEMGWVVHDDDTLDPIKGYLIEMVAFDPWLYFEFERFIQDEAARLDEDYVPPNEIGRERTIALTDRFLYTPSRFDGRTPPEVLIDRQTWISETQRQRLLDLGRRTFTGLFEVLSSQGDVLELKERKHGRIMNALVTRAGMARVFKPGMVIVTRLMPWDDQWVLSGVQAIQRGLKDGDQEAVYKELAVLEPDSLRNV